MFLGGNWTPCKSTRNQLTALSTTDMEGLVQPLAGCFTEDAVARFGHQEGRHPQFGPAGQVYQISRFFQIKEDFYSHVEARWDSRRHVLACEWEGGGSGTWRRRVCYTDTAENSLGSFETCSRQYSLFISLVQCSQKSVSYVQLKFASLPLDCCHTACDSWCS